MDLLKLKFSDNEKIPAVGAYVYLHKLLHVLSYRRNAGSFGDFINYFLLFRNDEQMRTANFRTKSRGGEIWAENDGKYFGNYYFYHAGTHECTRIYDRFLETLVKVFR